MFSHIPFIQSVLVKHFFDGVNYLWDAKPPKKVAIVWLFWVFQIAVDSGDEVVRGLREVLKQEFAQFSFTD